MQLSSLRYLIALDRERHFARAAAACNVTQPSLSSGIAALEQQLGRRLVIRDRRFVDLTPDGKAVLPWARQILFALEGMTLAAAASAGLLEGELQLGTIPAALPVVGAIAEELRLAYPNVRLNLGAGTSREIVRRLFDYTLDAGITYLEHEPPSGVLSVALYREHSVFVTRTAPPLDAEGRIGLSDALDHDLCLLNPSMQNRRILDANLATLGLTVRPRVTADSYVSLLALISTGRFATIMPDSYGSLLPKWALMIPIADPVPASAIGMIVPDRTPLSPLAAAALAVAEKVKTIDDGYRT